MNSTANKNTESELDEMNYNDRLDGYGFGEAECKDKDKEYEKDPHFTKHCKDLGEGYRSHENEPYTKDEYGLRNQYGEVDQYSFRGAPLRNSRPKKESKK